MGQLLVTNWCRASIGGVAFWLARAALHFTCSSSLVEENRSSTWILMCGFGSVGGPNTSKLYLAETAERKTDFYTHIFLFFRLATSSCWLLVWNCNQNMENQDMVETNLNLNITLMSYAIRMWKMFVFLVRSLSSMFFEMNVSKLTKLIYFKTWSHIHSE